MAPSCLRMLEDLQSLSRATDVTQWRAAWDASSHGFLKLDKLPAAAQQVLLQQHEITTALTSAIAAGLRVLMPLLPSISSGNKEAYDCCASLVNFMFATNAWCDAATASSMGSQAAKRVQCKLLEQGMSADFAAVLPKASQALAQLLPELTLQEVQQQQHYQQQAGRAARRHGRNKPHVGVPSKALHSMILLSWHVLSLWQRFTTECPLHGLGSALYTAGYSGPCSSYRSVYTGRAANSAAATAAGTGSHGFVFPEMVTHASPLAAAVMRCWHLLRLSADGDKDIINHMFSMIKLPLMMSVALALSVCRDVRFFLEHASSNPAHAPDDIAQLINSVPQLPWLMAAGLAITTAARHGANQGMPPMAASTASSSSNNSMVAAYHTQLLEALLGAGPQPAWLCAAQQMRSAFMDSGCAVRPTVFFGAVTVLEVYHSKLCDAHNSTAAELMPYQGHGPADGTAVYDDDSAAFAGSSSCSSCSSSSRPATAGQSTNVHVPGTSYITSSSSGSSWWDLDRQTLQLLQCVVAEYMALDPAPDILFYGSEFLKRLYLGEVQVKVAVRCESAAERVAKQPDSSSLFAMLDTSMLELVAQLVLPTMQQVASQHAQAASAPGAVTAGAHSMPAAGSSTALDNLHGALENTYGLVFCAAVDPPHDTVFHTQAFWRAPAAILAALESAVRAEFLWLGADPARCPGFGYMLCSAPRCLNQLIPQCVINARTLQQVAWALATSRAIYYTNKTSPAESNELVARINARSAAQSTQQAAGDQPLVVAGAVPASAAPAAAAPAADNSSSAKRGQPGVQNAPPVTGSAPASSQQVTCHLEYPDVAKVTAALASLLLSCLKVIEARHTSSPPQVTVTEMPVQAILSCLNVAVLVAGGDFTDSIFCSGDIVDSSSSSTCTALAEAPGSVSQSAGCSGDADSYCLLLPPGWGFLVGKALHTAGTLLDLHLNSWQPALLEVTPPAASVGEGDAACSSDPSCHDSFRLLAALSITHECLMLWVQLLPDASLAGSTEQQLTELALKVSEAVTAVQQSLTASQAGTAELLRSTAQTLLMADGGVVPADEMNLCNYSDTVSDLVTASREDDETLCPSISGRQTGQALSE